MKVILFLSFFLLIFYNCSPINKQHGYLLEDVVGSADEISKFTVGTTKEDEIFSTLGSPSIKISDINNVWIYLISIKRNNVFERDDVLFQSIFRFEFDKNGVLISQDFSNEESFVEIAFSQDKTRVISNTYGIADQIYQSLIREQ